jgi:hypothetical protein
MASPISFGEVGSGGTAIPPLPLPHPRRTMPLQFSEEQIDAWFTESNKCLQDSVEDGNARGLLNDGRNILYMVRAQREVWRKRWERLVIKQQLEEEMKNE